MMEGAVLIAGPTASGKSRMAMDWAARTGGVIVNTDSMQVYSGLRLLTARPDAADMASAAHLLYGHVDAATAYSTGQWARDVAALSAELAGRRAIFVGGTGLYFRALTEGLSRMPDVPAPIRTRWRERLKLEGATALYRILIDMDPRAAALLRETDGQRIVRALEVIEASGRSLLEWQGQRGEPLIDAASATRLLLTPDRDLLRARIDQRFDAMIGEGAMDEVRALVARDLDPALPAMRAIGVPEIAAHLSGQLSLTEAIERAKAATRQYAKRQMTWFRNQFGPEWGQVGSISQ